LPAACAAPANSTMTLNVSDIETARGNIGVPPAI
jgi:hypothetical protein